MSQLQLQKLVKSNTFESHYRKNTNRSSNLTYITPSLFPSYLTKLKNFFLCSTSCQRITSESFLVCRARRKASNPKSSSSSQTGFPREDFSKPRNDWELKENLFGSGKFCNSHLFGLKQVNFSN
jgi:hypothetical protein